MTEKILRVFPRKTVATPNDENVRIDTGPFLWDEADRIEISVTFTYDLPHAEFLAKQWEPVAPVEIGGPATGARGEEFVPGRYVKKGYVITSRGCPNRCWFCSVWRREGSEIRELPVNDGWNILDDNLLATSETHVREVFAMLKRMKPKSKEIVFTGGLEAAILQDWQIDLMVNLKPSRMYFAYDTPDDYEPLREAGKRLVEAGLLQSLYAYVLCGYPKDTMDAAEKRFWQTLECGFLPYAMLYRNKKGEIDRTWRKFQYNYSKPPIMAANGKRRLMSMAELEAGGSVLDRMDNWQNEDEIENEEALFGEDETDA